MKIYNKLVRDLIPQIIRNNGQECSFRQISDDDFLLFAENKLDEEVSEYHQEHTIEELIDIIEVIESIAESRGVSWHELEQIRKVKREEKGGFSNKILLEYVK